MNNRALWFVVPTDKAGATRHNGSGAPVLFSSAEKMAAWLGSRQGENCWYVRLLNRDSALEMLNEQCSDECREILADLDGERPRKIAMADLVLRLQNE